MILRSNKVLAPGISDSHAIVKSNVPPLNYNVDFILEQHVGSFGLWQFIVLLLTTITIPPSHILPVYINTFHTHRCKMPNYIETLFMETNLSFNEAARISGPWISDLDSEVYIDNKTGKEFGCYRYIFGLSIEDMHFKCKSLSLLSNLTALSFKNMSISIECMKTLLKNKTLETEHCKNGYLYKSSVFQYPSGVPSEFNLVCSKRWHSVTGTSIYMFGMMLGFIFGGWCGDVWGRRLTVIIFSTLEAIIGQAVSWSPNMLTFTVLRGIAGAAMTGKITCMVILPLELTLAKYRSYTGSFQAFIQNFIYRSALALVAYLEPRWRVLNSIVMAPCLLFIFNIFFLPESPRWLLSQGRRLEALLVLRRGYIINHFWQLRHKKTTVVPFENITNDTLNTDKLSLNDNITLTNSVDFECNSLDTKYTDNPIDRLIDIETSIGTVDPVFAAKLQTIVEERRRQRRFIGLLISFVKPFSTFQLARLSILTSLIFTSHIMCTFGLILYARFVHSYVYLVSFINAVSVIPGIVLSSALYRCLRNRRLPLMGICVIAFGIMLPSGLYTFIWKPKNDIILIISTNLSLIFISAGITMIYIYVPELYPSEMRTQGLGAASGLGRLGAVLCTYINQLDIIVGHGLPLLIFSSVLFFEMILLFFMSDTTGENLPDIMVQNDNLQISIVEKKNVDK